MSTLGTATATGHRTLIRQLPAGLGGDLRAGLCDKLVYVSAAVDRVVLEGDEYLRIDLIDAPADIESKIDRLIERFADSPAVPASRIVHRQPGVSRGFHAEIAHQLSERGELHRLGPGQYALSGLPLALLELLDDTVRWVGRSLGAEEHRFPTLIPIAAMQRIDYLSSRPECLHFVSHLCEEIDQIDDFSRQAKTIHDRVELGSKVKTDCLATVAVCLHAFHQLQDRDLGNEPRVIGAVGRCMRYESKNLDSLRRLRDFTMREIICVGTAERVKDFLRRGLATVEETLVAWGLRSVVATASDMFFTRELVGQSAFQQAFDLKLEFCAELAGEQDRLAIGSLNDHRDFIGTGFGIRAGGRPARSACLAYGLERTVFAFLSQHGLDPSHWPDTVARRMAPYREAVDRPRSGVR